MSFIIDQLSMRIKHDHCPKCGSDRLEIVWRAQEPDVVTYTCVDCKAVTIEAAR